MGMEHVDHLIPAWGVSTGMLMNFSKRCFHTLDKALEGQVMWPTEPERQDINDAFALKGFPDV